jgi:hypothetical protein
MFHKAKECYIRDKSGNRYFDLRRADNITGHSHKHLTTQIKNAVSTVLTLDLPTVYHKRYKKILQSLTCNGLYEICFFSTPQEFLLKVAALFNNIEAYTANMQDFLANHGIKKGNGIKLQDFTMQPCTNKEMSQSIAWYYNFPRLLDESDIPQADCVVLPALYTGYTGGCTVLINRNLKDLINIARPLEETAAIAFVTSTVFYYKAKALQEQKCFTFDNDKFMFNDRVFTLKDEYQNELQDVAASLKSNGVVINTVAPYYSYIPLTLDVHEIRRIKNALENC